MKTLLIVPLLLACPSWGAIVRVWPFNPPTDTWTAGGGSQFGTATLAAQNCSGANLLTAVVSMFDKVANATGATVEYSANGSSWTAMTPRTNTAVDTQNVTLWYAEGITGSATQQMRATPSANPTGGYVLIEGACYSGALSSAAYDTEVTGGSGVANICTMPGALTPAQNNELVIATLATDQSSGTFAINGSYTIVNSANLVNAQSEGGAHADLIQTTASSTQPTWTLSIGATDPACALTAFKAALAGGGQLTLMGVGH